MYAVIETGGKQYRVAPGDVIKVEKVTADAGQAITLDKVLMVQKDGESTVGSPTVAGASVSAKVVSQTRGPKLMVFKKKRRHNYRRKKGHRQDLTQIEITDINAA